MDQNLKIILKKLDEIENRLRSLEIVTLKEKNPSEDKVERDPLFPKAVEVIDKYGEISSIKLAKELRVDQRRAESIMDQMEAAGIGFCFTKEN
ncbi:MAG: hypothetical protein NZL96_02105 [Patescibacteria group bacterium]|nr:hypothetical protein [Patescibacteria group bacterium]